MFDSFFDFIWSIGIFQHRELATEVAQCLQIEVDRDGALVVQRTGSRGVAIGVNHDGSTAIMPRRVFADAIDTCHIALVLNGTGMQQRVPHGQARCRP